MVQWVKDLKLSLQRLRLLLQGKFNPWPRNFHIVQAQQKTKTLILFLLASSAASDITDRSINLEMLYSPCLLQHYVLCSSSEFPGGLVVKDLALSLCGSGLILGLGPLTCLKKKSKQTNKRRSLFSSFCCLFLFKQILRRSRLSRQSAPVSCLWHQDTTNCQAKSLLTSVQ